MVRPLLARLRSMFAGRALPRDEAFPCAPDFDGQIEALYRAAERYRPRHASWAAPFRARGAFLNEGSFLFCAIMMALVLGIVPGALFDSAWVGVGIQAALLGVLWSGHVLYACAVRWDTTPARTHEIKALSDAFQRPRLKAAFGAWMARTQDGRVTRVEASHLLDLHRRILALETDRKMHEDNLALLERTTGLVGQHRAAMSQKRLSRAFATVNAPAARPRL